MRDEPPIDVLDKRNPRANKSLGQHFLRDKNALERMVKHLDLKDKIVVEIGPGLGSLTEVLAKLPLRFLLLIEKDKRFISVLNELARGKVNFSCVEADALKVSIPALLSEAGYEGSYSIVANLPYNVGTELLVNWTLGLDRIESITIMLQKEVVDRLRAAVNSSDYGRLGILARNCFEVTELFRVPPSAFVPPPKVTSSVVYLKPKRPAPDPNVLKTLGKLTNLAFSARRKMLRASLGKRLPRGLWSSILSELNIDDAKRPETLSPETFYRMAELCVTRNV